MQISIIIPTYNYAHLVEKAIRSVIEQNDPNYELIIIDDGSTDNTAAVVEEYIKGYSSIRYIKQENTGLAGVRNRGIKESKGDYILFLDADDRLLPGALKKFRDFFNTHPNADAVFAGHTSIDTKGKVRAKKHPLKPLSHDRVKNFGDYIQKKYSFCNGAIMSHKRVFEKISYPGELIMAEDIFVNLYTLALFNCYTIPDVVLEVYKHPASLRNQISKNKHIGLKTVETIFDPDKLPEPFMKFKKAYCARRCLALFRGLYLAGEYKEAREYYYFAIKSCPQNLLLLPYLRKYLLSFFYENFYTKVARL